MKYTKITNTTELETFIYDYIDNVINPISIAKIGGLTLKFNVDFDNILIMSYHSNNRKIEVIYKGVYKIDKQLIVNSINDIIKEEIYLTKLFKK